MKAMKLNHQDCNNGILVHVLDKRMTTSHATKTNSSLTQARSNITAKIPLIKLFFAS